MTTTSEILEMASEDLNNLSGHVFDVLTLTKPISTDAAINLSKIVSKLSPLLGNLIEFNVVEFLNDQESYKKLGTWMRQDPGFPDTIFSGSVLPTPGFEIKAWFPLATEITARFKDSQNHFDQDQTNVCILTWMPEHVIYGKPKILDVCIVSGKSVAKARDDHYHRPPDYLVLEPEDTTDRTSNLQQTNTNGYKWQGSKDLFLEAEKIVQSWGDDGRVYKPTSEYQSLLRQLIAKYPYRLDTNFAKIDRIVHTGIEDFKKKVLSTEYYGLTIHEWAKLFNKGKKDKVKKILIDKLMIKEVDSENIVQ